VRRVDEFGQVALDMLGTIAEQFERDGHTLLLVDPEGTLAPALPQLTVYESREGAIVRCENLLLKRYGSGDLDPGRVRVADSPALAMLDQEDVDALAALMEPRSYADGEIIRRVGQRFGGVFFILSGQISTIATDPEGNR